MSGTDLMMMLMQAIGPEEGLEGIRQAFGKPPSPTDKVSMALVTILALTGVGLIYAAIRKRRFTPDGRPNYMHQATRILNLSLAERRDAMVVARRAGMNEPVAMFISRANLERALDQALHGDDDPELRRRMIALGQRIFGR